MSHRLDIPEAAFQWAGSSKRRCSGDAACEVDRLDGAAHRVGHREQEVRLLLQRMGLPVEASQPGWIQSVKKQRPERRIASARPGWTWAYARSFSRPLYRMSPPRRTESPPG